MPTGIPKKGTGGQFKKGHPKPLNAYVFKVGRKVSEDTRRKIGIKHKGKIVSIETRRKISFGNLGNKNMLGKHHSEATKQKIREKRALQIITPETCEKLRVIMKERVRNGFKPPSALGRKVTDETRKKIRENSPRYWLGKKQTQETIDKRRPKIKGENSGTWRGSEVGYHGIHKWLKLHFGKADKCESENCPRISGVFQWAKKTECKYERKRENFIMLCAPCHAKYDFTPEKRKRFLSVRYNQPKSKII